MIRTLLMGLVFGLSSFAYAAEERPSMSIHGTGTVKAKPDEGYIVVGVSTVAHKSAAAVATNTKIMRDLYRTLADKGVKEEGLRTIEFSVADHYKTVYEKDDDGKRQARQVKDGYVVNNVVHVTVCDLNKFGDVLDAVTANGANEVHSIRFGSSKAKEAIEQARKDAIADALHKADVLASGVGVKLGRVLSIDESGGRPSRMMYESAAAAPDMDRSVPVSGGSLSYSVGVSVRWELDQTIDLRKRPKITCCPCHQPKVKHKFRALPEHKK